MVPSHGTRIELEASMKTHSTAPDHSTARTPFIETMLKTTSQKLVIALLGGLLCFVFVTRPKGCVVYVEKSGVTDKCSREKSPKVTVDVFYESMCPDSKSFFDTEVKPTHDLMGEWITWRFIPFGKAEIEVKRNLTFVTCQHGKRECKGNKYHACMIRSATNETQKVNAISCMFKHIFDKMDTAAENCCQKHDLDFRKIQACAVGMEGMELTKEHKKSTDKIPLRFVPTIVLNKIRGPDAFQSKILKSLKTEVCNILKYEGVEEIDSICTRKPNSYSL